jgi:hypothetical protein
MLSSFDQFLQQLSRSTTVDEASVADNCKFDERADNQRWQAFADCLPHNDHARLNFGDWSEAGELHYEKRVTAVSTSTPDAFLECNHPAWLEILAPEQEVVRLETLEGLLVPVWNTDFEQFKVLHEAPPSQDDKKKALAQHFDNWNTSRALI